MNEKMTIELVDVKPEMLLLLGMFAMMNRGTSREVMEVLASRFDESDELETQTIARLLRSDKVLDIISVDYYPIDHAIEKEFDVGGSFYTYAEKLLEIMGGPPVMIDDYEVKFGKDKITVGCTDVSHDQIRKIAEMAGLL
jgi:hypothetical protein